jgi:hypothetical protein
MYVCLRIFRDLLTRNQLFESNAKPHLYMAGAKLVQNKRLSSYWRQEMSPNQYYVGFANFKKFFKDKTGIDWDDRCDNLPHQADEFVYTPPPGGRPVGDLPPGKFAPGCGPEAKSAAEGEGAVKMTAGNGNEGDFQTDSEVEDDCSTSIASSSSESVPISSTVSRCPKSLKSISTRSHISISSISHISISSESE